MGSAAAEGARLLEPLSLSVTGKVALVTGASSGIGRVLASFLVQRGCHVVAAARRKPALDSLVGELEGLRQRRHAAEGTEREQCCCCSPQEPCGAGGARCSMGAIVAVELDVAGSESHIEAVLGQAWAHFGGINVVVNNAGFRGPKADVLDITEEDFTRNLTTNVRGPWLVTKAVVRRIVAARRAAQKEHQQGTAGPSDASAGASRCTGAACLNSSSSSSSRSKGRDSSRDHFCKKQPQDDIGCGKGGPPCCCVALRTPPDLSFPSILHIASTAGVEGGLIPGGAAYSASKAALIRLTKAMAIEFGEHGIRCNAIAPGIFDSQITHKLLGKPWMQRNARVVVPLQRWGLVHPDLTSALLFFAADASAFITGNCLVVDGGHALMRMRLNPRL